jgi:hypothetical protein
MHAGLSQERGQGLGIDKNKPNSPITAGDVMLTYPPFMIGKCQGRGPDKSPPLDGTLSIPLT